MRLAPPTPTAQPALRGGSRRGWVALVFCMLALVVGVGGAVTWASAGAIGCGHTVETTMLRMQQIDKYLAMYVAISAPLYPSTAEGLAAASKYFPDGEVPKDAWGNEFIYTASGRGYEIISLGADGVEGGEDVDADIKSSEIKN